MTDAPTNIHLPPDSLILPSTSATVGRYTSTVTETVTVHTLRSGDITYEYPSTSSNSANGNPFITTVLYFDILTASSSTTSVITTSSMSASVLPNGETIGLSAGAPSTSSTSPSSASRSSASALCFNNDLQKDLPCSVTPTTATASETTDYYSSPGQSIVSSDSSRVGPPSVAGVLFTFYMFCGAAFMTWSILPVSYEVIIWVSWKMTTCPVWIWNYLVSGLLDLPLGIYGILFSCLCYYDMTCAVKSLETKVSEMEKSAGEMKDALATLTTLMNEMHSKNENGSQSIQEIMERLESLGSGLTSTSTLTRNLQEKMHNMEHYIRETELLGVPRVALGAIKKKARTKLLDLEDRVPLPSVPFSLEDMQKNLRQAIQDMGVASDDKQNLTIVEKISRNK